jgi:hypothetical protein
MEIRTRDLLVCSIVPQPTTLLRAPLCNVCIKYHLTTMCRSVLICPPCQTELFFTVYKPRTVLPVQMNVPFTKYKPVCSCSLLHFIDPSSAQKRTYNIIRTTFRYMPFGRDSTGTYIVIYTVIYTNVFNAENYTVCSIHTYMHRLTKLL